MDSWERELFRVSRTVFVYQNYIGTLFDIDIDIYTHLDLYNVST